MSCGAVGYGHESGKGAAPQPSWATEKTFLCRAAPVQTSSELIKQIMGLVCGTRIS